MSATVQFVVNGNVISVLVDDVTIRAGEADAGGTPDVRIVTSSRTLYDVGFGRRDPAAAVAAGEMTVEGDARAVARAYELSDRTG